MTSPSVLPAPLGGYLALLDRWVIATTGDPARLEAAAATIDTLLARESAVADGLETRTAETLTKWPDGLARESFRRRSSQGSTQLRLLCGGASQAAVELRSCARALRQAGSQTLEVRQRFESQAAGLTNWAAALPPSAVAVGQRALVEQGKTLGEGAIASAQSIASELGHQLSQSAEHLTTVTPYSGFVHRSLGRLFGSGAATYPWERSWSYPMTNLGFVGAGAVVSPFVKASILMGSPDYLPFAQAFKQGLLRIPGSALNDVLITGLFNPSVTGIDYLNNPLASRLAGDTLTAGTLMLTDQAALGLSSRIQGITGAAAKLPLSSGLRPLVLGAIPYTVEAANAAADFVITKPAFTDGDNLRWHANLWGHSAATGAGVAGPILWQTKNVGSSALALGVVTAQGVISKYAFGDPPPNPDPVYNVLHSWSRGASDTLTPYADAVARHPATVLTGSTWDLMGAATDYGNNLSLQQGAGQHNLAYPMYGENYWLPSTEVGAVVDPHEQEALRQRMHLDVDRVRQSWHDLTHGAGAR